MAERKYKCYGTCGEKYLKEEMLVHSNKKYCKKCYEEVIKETEDRQNLYNLIKMHYGVTFPTKMHLAQIKNEKNKGYSYYDMILAINYCVNVLHMRFNPKMGFGYVSNKLEDAKIYYHKQEIQKMKALELYNDKVVEEHRVIVEKLDNTNKLKAEKTIGLEDIL